MNNVKHTWVFPSRGLKALWDHEISGQLSDGAWENTAPYDHWEFWCNLKTVVGEGWNFIKGMGDRPRKRTGYNLTTLVDPECDLSGRMRAYYVDAEIGMGLEREAEMFISHRGATLNANTTSRLMGRADVIKELAKLTNPFWVERRSRVEAITPEKYTEFCIGYANYSREDLIKDLREIKKQMKAVLAAV